MLQTSILFAYQAWPVSVFATLSISSFLYQRHIVRLPAGRMGSCGARGCAGALHACRGLCQVNFCVMLMPAILAPSVDAAASYRTITRPCLMQY